jgi:hypothetical protein
LKGWRKTGLLLVLLASILGVCMGATAGTEADPLVTKGWVDQYIDRQIADVTNQLDSLEDKLQNSMMITLKIGQSYMDVDGKRVTLDSAPFISSEGRTYVPLRALGEAIGATFVWDNATKKVTYTREGRQINLWVGKTAISVNGVPKETDAAPQILNGRTMVPLRVISENFGFYVKWNNSLKQATLIY